MKLSPKPVSVQRHTVKLTLILALLIAATMLGVGTALAHARVELGPYVVVVGWENEPVIVGERNAIVVDVTDENGMPVEGLESSLDVSVLYAGSTFSGNLSPTVEAGLYSVEIFPTVRGQYTVLLEGSIRELDVSEMVEPEEVLPASVLTFPETQPDTRDLQADIAELEARLQTATIVAIAGVVLGAIGIATGALSVLRSRPKSD